MEYTFSGELTFDDYVQLQIVFLRNTIFTKKRIILYALFLVFFVSSLFFLIDRFSAVSTGVLLIIAVLVIFISVLLILPNLKLLYKKSFESNKTITEHCNYIINENTISGDFESGSLKLKKDTIYNIVFDEDSIYIFTAVNIAKIIKKRFFENGEQYNEFVLFIKENIRKKGRE